MYFRPNERDLFYVFPENTLGRMAIWDLHLLLLARQNENTTQTITTTGFLRKFMDTRTDKLRAQVQKQAEPTGKKISFCTTS